MIEHIGDDHHRTVRELLRLIDIPKFAAREEETQRLVHEARLRGETDKSVIDGLRKRIQADAVVASAFLDEINLDPVKRDRLNALLDKDIRITIAEQMTAMLDVWVSA